MLLPKRALKLLFHLPARTLGLLDRRLALTALLCRLATGPGGGRSSSWRRGRRCGCHLPAPCCRLVPNRYATICGSYDVDESIKSLLAHGFRIAQLAHYGMTTPIPHQTAPPPCACSALQCGLGGCPCWSVWRAPTRSPTAAPPCWLVGGGRCPHPCSGGRLPPHMHGHTRVPMVAVYWWSTIRSTVNCDNHARVCYVA